VVPSNLCQNFSSVITAKCRISLNNRVRCECHICFRIVFTKKLKTTCESCLRRRLRSLVVVYVSERYGALRLYTLMGHFIFVRSTEKIDEVYYIAIGALYHICNPVLVWE
jgi:hypothetical protein